MARHSYLDDAALTPLERVLVEALTRALVLELELGERSQRDAFERGDGADDGTKGDVWHDSTTE